MSHLNLEICTDAARLVNIIDEITSLSPEQGEQALTALNDMLLDYARDGIDVGWYAQTDLSATAPLEDEDVRCVKLCLAKELAARNGLLPTLDQELKDEMKAAYQKLSKRTQTYFESDLSGLPIPQGSYWGGGRA
jgi:hypothetical protein